MWLGDARKWKALAGIVLQVSGIVLYQNLHVKFLADTEPLMLSFTHSKCPSAWSDSSSLYVYTEAVFLVMCDPSMNKL